MHAPGPRVKLLKLPQSLLKVPLNAEDSHQLLHRLLQIAMNRVGRFAVSILKWRQHFAFGLVDLSLVYFGLADLFGSLSGAHARPPAENEQVRKGIAAQAIRAMQSRGDFACGVQS